MWLIYHVATLSQLEMSDTANSKFRQLFSSNSTTATTTAGNVKVLGHLVDGFGVRPDFDKTQTVREFSVLESLKDTQSFLGLC